VIYITFLSSRQCYCWKTTAVATGRSGPLPASSFIFMSEMVDHGEVQVGLFLYNTRVTAIP
jgi:hypothetical protein